MKLPIKVHSLSNPVPWVHKPVYDHIDNDTFIKNLL